MITGATLEFLEELKKNNTREWFTANKALYENAKKELLTLTGKLIRGISSFDETIREIIPEDCLFRIHRDIRFSKDKTPYKVNMGSFISKGGRKSLLPGYYLHVEPGNSFLSGGIYMPSPENLKKIRSEIYYRYDEFCEIIFNPQFKSCFGDLWGEKLSRPPKDFPVDFEGIGILKHKHFVSYHQISDWQLTSEDFIAYALKVYETTYPLNSFINTTLY